MSGLGKVLMGSNPVSLTQLNKEPTARETVSHRHLYAVTMTTVSATTTTLGLYRIYFLPMPDLE